MADAQDRPGLGGSDVAAVAGVSPFKTALDVYREKVLGQEESVTPAMLAGIRFEPFVLAAYAREQQVTLSNPGRIVKDWRRATVDSLAERDGWQYVVEGKTTGYGAAWGDDGSEDVPPVCAAQGQWYLDLHELPECHFPVLTWPRDLRGLLGMTCEEIVAVVGIRVLKMRFSQNAADILNEKAARFWNENVLPRVAPPAVDLEDCKRFIREASGKTAEMDAEIERLARDLRHFRLARKELEEQEARAEFAFRMAVRALGDPDALTKDGWKVVTIKPQERKAHSVKASRSQPIVFTNKWTDQP